MKKTISNSLPLTFYCFWCNQNVAHEGNKDPMNGYYNCPNHEYKIQFLYVHQGSFTVYNEFYINTVVNIYLNPKLVVSFEINANETSLWELRDVWYKSVMLPNDLLLRDLDFINNKIKNLVAFL